MNKEGRIIFRLFYVDKKHGYGYEVIDTLDDEVLKRQVGFKRPEESREAGFESAKQIITQLEG